jgi:hypothetical protein
MKKQLRQPVYLVLVAVSLLSIPLTGYVGFQELSLPFSIASNELRLFQPVEMNEFKGDILKSASSGKDHDIAEYLSCIEQETSVNCAPKLQTVLARSPADGAIWLEYSKVLAREGDTAVTAEQALNRSYDVSSHEGWLLGARANYAFSVWDGLTDELKQKALAEIGRALPDPHFIDLLAKLYIEKPFAHNAIQQSIEQATPQQKLRFLRLINNATKS